MDSASFANYTKLVNDGKVMTRAEYKKLTDSLDHATGFTIIGDYYESRAQYDSLLKAGKVKNNWFGQMMTEKNFELRSKYKNRSELVSSFWNKLSHYFPQILFISLPFFALFLKLIYFRRKEFYFVSHGIYSIHLYIFYFIFLLINIGLYQLEDKSGWSLFKTIQFLLLLFLLFYEYKAMRNFYNQGRAKTMLKFLLALFGRCFIIILLFVIFLILSVFNI